MKKTILLFTMLMVMIFTSKAQFTENFDAVTDGAIPTGWTRFNVDALAPNSAVSWVNDAWVCFAKTTLQIPSKCAWSTSWYASAGTSNDWMFTPSITIPATKPMLQFLAVAQDPAYPDGYEVRIMTAAPTSSNLMTSTVVLSVAAEASSPTTRMINLSAFAGQTVYIGWRNNSVDMYLLGIDDVSVATSTLQDNDAKAVSINITPITAAGSTSIKGTIENVGFNAITSYDVTYTIDGGAASAVYSVTGQNIGLGTKANFTHNVPANLTAGAHTIEVTISNVNGSTDPNPADNVISKTISVASQLVNKLALIEGFSSSTCAPCYTWNTGTFNAWAAANENNMNYIKYQVDWPLPGDPYYIAAAGDRVTYYDVTGVPDMYHDGAPMTLSTAGLNAAITDATAKKAPFAISCTMTVTGNNVSVPVTINPYVTISGLKVHCVIIEKKTTGNVGNNNETEWHHVMMAMLPTSAGTTVSFTDGTAYTNTFTKDMTGTFVEEMSDLTAVIFIQDDVTKEIYQSKTFGYPSQINENSFGSLLIYPNPSTDIVNIINAENSNIQMYDVFGKLVASDKVINNNYSLNVSEFAKGTYVLKITNGEQSISKKITVL